MGCASGAPDRPLKGTGKLEHNRRILLRPGPFAQVIGLEADNNLCARVMNA
jgi:hypothetical protein